MALTHHKNVLCPHLLQLCRDEGTLLWIRCLGFDLLGWNVRHDVVLGLAWAGEGVLAYGVGIDDFGRDLQVETPP